jgi:hypothetical protein
MRIAQMCGPLKMDRRVKPGGDEERSAPVD